MLFIYIMNNGNIVLFGCFNTTILTRVHFKTMERFKDLMTSKRSNVCVVLHPSSLQHTISTHHP